MLLSLNWLREFVPFTGSAQELGDRLTMLGLELEDILHPYDDIKDIVVGHVLTCEPHPESDHLHVCTVDVGPAGEGEALPIVCGASNVAAGQKVPVALVGTIMPGGLKIKQAKLRGAVSCGMICSERELGLTEDHSGIMVLEPEARVGARLIDVLALDTEVLEIGITPNRADALSVLGIARETALAFKLPLTLPRADVIEQGGDWTGECPVTIADGSLCPLYQLRFIENVSVGPSPAWMRYRLHAIGVRPISNIVDVTNYILMELGQPLHAFDRDRLEGAGITVSPAHAGESIVTLDGQERRLVAGDLLIRDGVKPVALAGVMGGANSDMTDTSRNVLLESAIFHPGTIRKTARRLGLSSEASYRFERGVDQVGNTYAMNRAAALIADLSGGSVRPGVSRAEPLPWQPPKTVFRRSRCVSLLGLEEHELAEPFCRETLAGLGCSLDERAPDAWQVETPSWRQDLTREVDLIEEVARVYGMDRIPETLPVIERSLERAGEPEGRHAFLARVRRWGAGLGLNEAVNYSFTGHTDLDRLGLPKAARIAILNPLSEELNVLRTALAPGLLANVRTNIAHGASGIRLFEVASAFTQDNSSETTAHENTRLGFALYGARHDSVWGWGEADSDYQELRGLIEHFLAWLHLPAPVCRMEEAHAWLSPCVTFVVDGGVVGFGGRVNPSVAEAYHARKPVWIAELDIDALYAMQLGRKPRFVSLPVYPPVRRDMTVPLPGGMSVEAVMAAIRDLKLGILEGVILIDLFQAEGSDERNATYRLTFRHPQRTLKDTEVDKERDRIAAALTQKLGVSLQQ